jgi:signal peptidase I
MGKKNKIKTKYLLFPAIQTLLERLIPFFAVLLFIFVSIVFVFNDKFPFKYKIYVVTSESMEPTFYKGDLIITSRESNYSVDDVITYQKDFTHFTISHRIVESNNNIFKTKGDNNDENDDWDVIYEEIRGKLIKVIPDVGWIVEFSRSYAGIIFLGIIPSTAVLSIYLNKRYEEYQKEYGEFVFKEKNKEP